MKNIIFFDGVCGLCNKSIDWFIRRDNKRRFVYAPLQGITAVRLLAPAFTQQINSFVYHRQGKIYSRSTAALWALFDLGGLWKLVAFFLVIPPFLRNLIYDWIARNRYRWFGKKDSCRLPSPEERSLFLD
ncbi:MAG: thiol-disulfide oxidoreductase DCC family protein [Flavobacteriales bacterium]